MKRKHIIHLLFASLMIVVCLPFANADTVEVSSCSLSAQSYLLEFIASTTISAEVTYYDYSDGYQYLGAMIHGGKVGFAGALWSIEIGDEFEILETNMTIDGNEAYVNAMYWEPWVVNDYYLLAIRVGDPNNYGYDQTSVTVKAGTIGDIRLGQVDIGSDTASISLIPSIN